MFEYNDERHEYLYRGVDIPSVTTVLPDIKLFMSQDDKKRKMQEGKDRHGALKMFLDTGDTFDDPFVVGFKDWMDRNASFTGSLIEYETPRMSVKHMYAGTPDLVFEKAVVDVKSSLYALTHFSLQLAGYHGILVEAEIIRPTKKHIVVYPGKNGFEGRNVHVAGAERIFLNLVKSWHYRREAELFMKGVR